MEREGGRRKGGREKGRRGRNEIVAHLVLPHQVLHLNLVLLLHSPHYVDLVPALTPKIANLQQ